MAGKIKNLKNNPVCVRAGVIGAVSAVCFAVVFLMDNSREINRNGEGQSILERNDPGEGKSTGELEARIGDVKENVSFSISEQAYSPEKLAEVFEQAGEDLESLILGENRSIEEVRSDLDLITEIPDSGISVSWQLDNYNVMDIQGNIFEEELTEDGILVKLTAVLSYGSEKASHEFYARVYPPEKSREEKLLKKIDDEIRRSDEDTKTEDYLVLPDNIDGQKVSWSYVTDTRAFGILVLGIGAASMAYVSEKQKKKEAQKKRIRQMKTEYPQIINKFNLYIGAGMTLRKAWFCIAHEYEKNRNRTGKKDAYEEMLYTMHQIQGGSPEGECYENYGIRCGVSAYRKFGTMLSQNLRKGSRGLTEILKREAEEAFEERRNLAKKMGEEAGTKLMIPMFMMLAVVFIIVTVPAFFTIQI